MKLKESKQFKGNYEITQNDGIDSVLLTYAEVIELREIITKLFKED